jgi:hypothetical protein
MDRRVDAVVVALAVAAAEAAVAAVEMLMVEAAEAAGAAALQEIMRHAAVPACRADLRAMAVVAPVVLCRMRAVGTLPKCKAAARSINSSSSMAASSSINSSSYPISKRVPRWVVGAEDAAEVPTVYLFFQLH